MLLTRSARLAALMLLTLLAGWKVRSCRKEGAAASFPATPSPAAPREQAIKSGHPDE